MKDPQPEAICIRQHGDGARELVGDWPLLTAVSHDLLTEGCGVIFFDGQMRMEVVINDHQRQAYRLASRYWTSDAALFIREDLPVDD